MKKHKRVLFTFGKYKRKEVSSVYDIKYLTWASSQNYLPLKLRLAIKSQLEKAIFDNEDSEGMYLLGKMLGRRIVY